MADMKTAAYICKGCGIGERVDTAQMAKIATKEGKMHLAREHDFLCSAAGVQTITDDIEKEGVTHAVIAACSRRAKTEAFYFPSVALARANIREGVIWARPDTEEARETTQEMADDYLRMGCAELKKMQLPGGNPDPGHAKRLLVVGGGISGLTAALEASRTGYQVVLVEKSASLGGWAAELYRRMPFREPYAEPQDTGMAELIKEVTGDANIKVITNAVIARTDGAPGRFKVDISVESGPSLTEEVGAIIQATGFTTYDIAKLPELGGGKSPNVIDQATLEKLAKEAAAKGQPMRRPSDGGEVKTVVFVQCAGQRDESGKHLPYCSGFCCGASVKQAMYFKDANPAVDTVVIYDDLRMPGNGEDFYRSAQKKGVTFTKGKVASVEAKGDVCQVKFRDLILDEDATIAAADLVVLATGQVPNSGVNIDIPAEEVAQMEVKPVSILNLSYRQGKDLPQLTHGFTDSHFICFPYETRRTGIYSAGSARQAMDLAASATDGAAAALKAIQSIEESSAGAAVHPRSGDLTYPKFFMQKCTSCGRCSQECPFGALEVDEKNRPALDPNRCRRCGICMGACPVQIISFEDYSVDILAAMIKAVEIPDDADKPRILLLACENDAYPALDMAGILRLQYAASVRVIPVRCMGSVNSILIADAVSRGFDGVALMGCKSGEDYQCHFIRGSELLATRMQNVRETLDRLALESERVSVMEVAISDAHRIPALLEEFTQTIKRIGPNPMKGFE